MLNYGYGDPKGSTSAIRSFTRIMQAACRHANHTHCQWHWQSAGTCTPAINSFPNTQDHLLTQCQGDHHLFASDNVGPFNLEVCGFKALTMVTP